MLTMFLPYQVTMIPTLLVFRAAGLTDLMLPLILPACLGNAFFIFLMRQFMRTLPEELLDAARMDGCSEFWRVPAHCSAAGAPRHGCRLPQPVPQRLEGFPRAGDLPVRRVDLAIVASLAAVSERAGYRSESILACATVFTIPLLVIFLFTQRYFIEGVTFSGIKG